jgi:lipopolysaccharide transport protein LptA
MMLGLCSTWALTADGAPAIRSASVLHVPAEGPEAARELRLSADQLTYSPTNQRVELSGSVAARLGALSLRCDRLMVKLDERGQPVTVRARGNVAIRRGEARGRAVRVRLLALAGALVLEGEATLMTGTTGLVLRGRRIRLDLQSGRVAVDRARAMLSPGGRGVR